MYLGINDTKIKQFCNLFDMKIGTALLMCVILEKLHLCQIHSYPT